MCATLIQYINNNDNNKKKLNELAFSIFLKTGTTTHILNGLAFCIEDDCTHFLFDLNYYFLVCC